MFANFRQKLILLILFITIIMVVSLNRTLNLTAAAQVPAVQDELPPNQNTALAKIDPQVLKAAGTEGEADFFIHLTAQADLSPAYLLKSKAEKGQFVFDALQATAASGQRDLRQYLDAQGVSYRPYYISNKILVRSGSQPLLMSVAARPDVASISANQTYQLTPPLIADKSPAEILSVEPNISFVNADDVWGLGITGDGVVLAGNDTGIDWDHPALINQYRGWNGTEADHNYNWWDASRTYTTVPGDGNGHGTHTTGTMLGSDGGSNQIGVAPGARMIHCKNLNDFGSGDDAMATECFEWDLAPWDLNGQNPRPDLAPDAINNSWGYSGGGVTFMQTEIEALQAAGILIEVSAGNDGPGCSTLGSPGDYGEVLTTGSIDHSSGALPGTISFFSSRGPSSLSADFIPDVMAPGENIRSSIPGGGYEGGWSGTSMSGPHVTGLVGLMWSANPALQGLVAETNMIIQQTAVPLSDQIGSNCGGDYSSGPNNDWGYGTIDALAAVQAAMLFGDPGTLTGTISATSTGAPLTDVRVTAQLTPDLSWKRDTDSSGLYSMLVFSGTYTVSAQLYGYYPETIANVQVISEQTTTQDIAMQPAPFYTVSGTITDAVQGWPLYARINVAGYPGDAVWTDPQTGAYSLSLAAGVDYTFQVTPWSTGYNTQNRFISALTGDQTQDFALQPNLLICAAPGYLPDYVYFADFEADDGGYTIEGGLTSWAWGLPASGPHTAVSGSNVWATNLTGNYGNNEDGFIVSPDIDLSAYGGQTLIVSWWQWLQTEPGYDYGRVEASNDGGATWNIIYWTDGDASTTWTKQSVLLDDSYAVGNFRLRFGLGSDFSITFPGFYIDDVGVGVVANTPFLYNQDFEADAGGFIAAGSNSSWEWGVPTRGPGSAYSGLNAWATSLGSSYNNDENSTLTSPDIDLSGAVGDELLLTWWQWLQTETLYDAVSVDVSNDGGSSWTTMVGPLSGPIDTAWNRYSLVLDSSYAVNNFRIRFSLQTDNTVTYPGLYVDDVAVRVYTDAPPAVACDVQSGGLVLGHVYDLNTAAALTAATITNDHGQSSLTQTTPADTAVDDGFYIIFSPAGDQSLSASKAQYATDAQSVNVLLGGVVRQDFNLDAGLLVADPPSIAAALDMGSSTTLTFMLANNGGLAAEFELREKETGFTLARVSTLPDPAQLLAGQTSAVAPDSYVLQTAVAAQAANNDELVCIFQDYYPWGVADVENFLAANGIAYQIYGSADFATMEFNDCHMIVFSGDQPAPFYDAYAAQADKFEAYVAAGGFLNFFAADNGWNGGMLTAPLPGGVNWNSLYFENYNDIDLPDHPVVLNVPDPFSGDFASHGHFSNLPAEALIIAHGQQGGQPTIIEYAVGRGTVLAFGQPLEIAHNFGWQAGLILENTLLYGYNHTPADVAWLSFAPVNGTVTAVSGQPIEVTLDASVPEITQPGDYLAEIRVVDDTPYTMANVSVLMTVNPPANWGKLSGVVSGLGRCDVPGSPLHKAVVTIDGMVTLKTAVDGVYGYWMEPGSYTVSVSAPGYVGQTHTVTISSGQTTSANVDLRRNVPCGSSDTTALVAHVAAGESSTAVINLSNSGAGDLTYTILESGGRAGLAADLRRPAEGTDDFHAAAAVGPQSVRFAAGWTGLMPAAPDSGWFAGADHPDGIIRYAHAQCDEQAQSFYVISGVDGTFQITDKVWRYDGAQNVWIELAPIPQGQEGAAAVCYQGRIYVMGGGGTNQFYIYDIAADTWLVGAALPRNVWGAAAAAWDGKVVLAGGDDDFWAGGTSNQVNVYDIAADTWSAEGALLPEAVVIPGYVQAGPYLYVVGGWGDASPTVNVSASQRYDLVNDTWESGPSLLNARADMALAMTTEALYAIGGDADGSSFFDPTRAVERLPLADWPTASWSDLGDPLPVATTANNAGFCSSGFFPAQIWSVGGLLNWNVSGLNRFLGRPLENCPSIYEDVAWLAVDPTSSTIDPDAAGQIMVTFDTTTLSVGDYEATLVIVSNDSGTAQLRLPVTLHVGEASGGIVLYMPIVFN